MSPARFWVVRTIRLKYACKDENCEGVERAEGERAVKISPVPLQLIPKSIATPSLLSHISDFLGDYRGYVQTDGCSGYDFLDNRESEGIIHVGCWAHSRRKFFAVVKMLGGKGKVKNLEGFGKAGEALQTIRDLYAIEKKAHDMGLPPDMIYEERQHGLEPSQYLLYLFDKLPGLDSGCDDQLRALLPMNLTPAILADHKKEYLKSRGQEGIPYSPYSPYSPHSPHSPITWYERVNSML